MELLFAADRGGCLSTEYLSGRLVLEMVITDFHLSGVSHFGLMQIILQKRADITQQSADLFAL